MFASIQQADQFMETFHLENFLHTIIFSENKVSFPDSAIFKNFSFPSTFLYWKIIFPDDDIGKR
jgi:hypothetical protein